FWARSAVTAFQPHLAGDCGVWHGTAQHRMLQSPSPFLYNHGRFL
ncbi:hypothetical protein GRZ59_13100, partial [Lactobacillus paracasei]|nr:hypothetical protein [Lacticaseibacillus paracasei]